MKYASLDANLDDLILLFSHHLSGMSHNMTEILLTGTLRKEEGKYQESIQSSITPDPGHHMEK